MNQRSEISGVKQRPWNRVVSVLLLKPQVSVTQAVSVVGVAGCPVTLGVVSQ